MIRIRISLFVQFLWHRFGYTIWVRKEVHFCAIFSSEKDLCTDNWAFVARASAYTLFFSRWEMAEASACGSFPRVRIPFFLSVIKSLFSGISVVITGSRAAIASRRAFDIPSKRVGRTKQLLALRISGTSER